MPAGQAGCEEFMRQVDAIVLGAGMVGVSTALHLQARGLSVVLVDRKGPGEETSYGNAGIIEHEALEPVAPPRDPRLLLQLALNRRTEAHYHPRFLPWIAPWILRLARYGTPAGVKAYARAMTPISAHVTAEHAALMQAAGAERYFRKTGWLRLYRSDAAYRSAEGFHRLADEFGVPFERFEGGALRELEPHLKGELTAATRWPMTWSVSSPGGVTKAYAELFSARGGVVARGDARSLAEAAGVWAVKTDDGEVRGRRVVMCLGPWSMDHLRPMGLDLPFAVKRGYHRHYRPAGNALLNHPVVDTAYGFVLAPMEQGIRLTTGVEFADRDAPKTPVQLRRLEPIARELFPLEAAVEPEPWMGARPCLADSLPVIGQMPGKTGLWLNFGHGHLGFTQGPVSGRLIAEMMLGQPTVIDPAAFRPDRFAGGHA